MTKFWSRNKNQKPLPVYLRLIKYLLLIFAGLTVAVYLLRGLVYFGFWYLSLDFENEEEMREKFSSRLPAMQQLEQMQRIDSKLSVMALDFYRITPESREEIAKSSVGLSEARWREYRNLLAQAKVHSLRINTREKPRVVNFWVNELSGYAYLEEPPSKNYHTVMECRNDGNPGTCYVYLSDHWYLYFRSGRRPKS